MRACLSAAAILLLAGCATSTTEREPPAAPDSYSSVDGTAQSAAVDPRWWQGFEDDRLDALMDEALAGNLDIAVARQRIEEAEALLGAARADLLPTLDAAGEAGWSWPLGEDEADARETTEASAILGWTPDIFGRTRFRARAARASLAAAGYSEADIRRLTTSTVAGQYIELRRAGARLALLDSSLELQRRTLDIVQSRFDAGLSAALDVDRAAADLARTSAQRGLLQASRQNAAFALSVLTGDTPGGEEYGNPQDDIIPRYDSLGGVGIPGDLLRARPDLRQAEAALVRELALVDAERADLLPALSLRGLVVTAGGDTSAMADTLATITAALDVPIFDGGRRRGELRAQRARAEAAALLYRATLLDALREVEAALVQIEALEQRRERLQTAVDRSRAAYEQLNALYREGLASFIDVLDAQRTLISTREALVENEAALATAVITLHTALGGGVIGTGQPT